MQFLVLFMILYLVFVCRTCNGLSFSSTKCSLHQKLFSSSSNEIDYLTNLLLAGSERELVKQPRLLYQRANCAEPPVKL